VANDFVVKLKPKKDVATIVGLRGDLGSGKTTFTQFVAKALGVEGAVTSPTFVIEKVYKLSNQEFKYLVHIDAYRLENKEELEKLGWNDLTNDPKNLILIEWPERVSGLEPKEDVTINFKVINESAREININV